MCWALEASNTNDEADMARIWVRRLRFGKKVRCSVYIDIEVAQSGLLTKVTIAPLFGHPM